MKPPPRAPGLRGSGFVGNLVGCLTSQQHASVSQGRICSDKFNCCYTEIEVADQTFYLTQSQYTDIGPTIPSTDPITPGALQGSHWCDSTRNKSRRKRDSNIGFSAFEADALATRPTKCWMERERERERQTDRQTDRQTHTHTHTHTHTYTHTHTDRDRQTQRERETDRQTERERERDKHTHTHARTHTHTHAHTHTQTETETSPPPLPLRPHPIFLSRHFTPATSESREHT